jgi:hypothetical protein
MRLGIVVIFTLLTAGCGSGQSTSPTGATDTSVDPVHSETYASARERLDAKNTAREAALDNKNYRGLRGTGMSDDQAAEVVAATRELCPHTDDAGKCD